MKLLRIIFWPLIMLKNILDGNWWADKIGEKSGAYEKARNSKMRAWADSLTGWKWWEWQIGGCGLFLVVLELLINQIGLTMLLWR